MLRRSPLFISTTISSRGGGFLSFTVPLLQRRAGDYFPSTTSSTDQSLTPAPPESSWSYAEVDELGRTDLDRKYDETAQRVKKQFQQPIEFPEGDSSNQNRNLPGGRTKECDFLIGFSQYRYNLRNSYRKTIALALNECNAKEDLLKEVAASQEENNNNNKTMNDERDDDRSKDKTSSSSLSATNLKNFTASNIDLTVAWNGRFALHKFRGCHKVVGVSLVFPNINNNNNNSSSSMNENTSTGDELKGNETKEESSTSTHTSRRHLIPDTESKIKVINQLVTAINEQRTKALLEMGMTRSTPTDVLIDRRTSGSNNIDEDEDPIYAAAVSGVEREIKNLSRKHKVVFFYNSQSEKATMEKLRPLIFGAKVAPLLINIDTLESHDGTARSSSTATTSTLIDFPQSTAVLEEHDDDINKRRVVLRALSNFYFRSHKVFDSNSKVNNNVNDENQDLEYDDYGKSKLDRKSTFDDGTTRRRKTMKFPMIFINGSYFGTASHLMRMKDESHKLEALINRPLDLKMRQSSKYRHML